MNKKKEKNGPTDDQPNDRRTDRPTNRPKCRVACLTELHVTNKKKERRKKTERNKDSVTLEWLLSHMTHPNVSQHAYCRLFRNPNR